MPDEEKPHQIIAEYRDHLAPGSYLAITHGITAATPEDDPDGVVESVTNVYQNASAQIHVRSTKEIERFFDGFEIIEPGIVWTADWRPDPGTRPAGRPARFPAWRRRSQACAGNLIRPEAPRSVRIKRFFNFPNGQWFYGLSQAQGRSGSGWPVSKPGPDHER